MGRYAEWLSKGNPELEFLDLIASPDLAADMSRVHGLVLTGGSDVHPARYNAPQDLPLCHDIDEARDAAEHAPQHGLRKADVPRRSHLLE